MPDQGRGARLRALVTNDDGIDSEGLWHLAAAAAQAGLDVVVAAPASDASGIGSAIRADVDTDGRVEVQSRELPSPAVGIPAYALKATPGFIVVAAMRGAFGATPQYVLSGVNRGLNTGRGVLSSGTVAAALVALPNGAVAAAFSLDVKDPPGESAVAPPEWHTARLVASQVIPILTDLPRDVALNVNIPNLPPDRLDGIHQTTLATFGTIQAPVAPVVDGYLHLGLPAPPYLPDPGSDVTVVASGRVSVTPVRGACEVAAVSLPWPVAAKLR